MKVLVVGTGAVGGYFGGRLAQAGHEVYFIARGEHKKAIEQHGLVVESINGDFTVRPAGVSDKFAPLEKLGLILVCVKRLDTAAVLDVLAEQVGKDTVVMSLQNGVDVEKELFAVVPESNLVAGIAFIGSAISSPGRLRHTAKGVLTIGELNGSQSPRALAIKKMFDDAGAPCALSTEISKARWEKLMWNAGFNGVCALAGKTVHQLLDFKPADDLVKGLMEELAAVAEKLGINVNRSLIEKYVDNGRKGGDVTPSMLQDVRHGRQTEINHINGKIREEGRKLGVPTPLNDAIWTLVSAIDRR
jgi:2-dehydropantoate 2-reductase